ncbi:hypothetical protein DRO27_02830, partial [Candidatus Bathyarchaeota archaeon]
MTGLSTKRTWRWVTQQEGYGRYSTASAEYVTIHAHEDAPHVGMSGWRSDGMTGEMEHKVFTEATGIVVPNT